jgi:hypothetical protein
MKLSFVTNIYQSFQFPSQRFSHKEDQRRVL